MRPITATLALAGLLAAMAPALAQERVGNSVVEQVLGGSFFPFARSFPRPPERCVRLADSLKDMRDDGTLQEPDFRKLRRAGCAGAGAF